MVDYSEQLGWEDHLVAILPGSPEALDSHTEPPEALDSHTGPPGTSEPLVQQYRAHHDPSGFVQWTSDPLGVQEKWLSQHHAVRMPKLGAAQMPWAPKTTMPGAVVVKSKGPWVEIRGCDGFQEWKDQVLKLKMLCWINAGGRLLKAEFVPDRIPITGVPEFVTMLTGQTVYIAHSSEDFTQLVLLRKTVDA